jgi:hypothetical protein
VKGKGRFVFTLSVLTLFAAGPAAAGRTSYYADSGSYYQHVLPTSDQPTVATLCTTRFSAAIDGCDFLFPANYSQAIVTDVDTGLGPYVAWSWSAGVLASAPLPGGLLATDQYTELAAGLACGAATISLPGGTDELRVTPTAAPASGPCSWGGTGPLATFGTVTIDLS